MNFLRNLASFARMLCEEIPRTWRTPPAEVVNLRPGAEDLRHG